MSDTSSPTLDTLEAAAYLRLSPATLITWRSRRTGPPYVKLGSRVGYVQSELDAWRTAQTVNPSSSEPRQ